MRRKIIVDVTLEEVTFVLIRDASFWDTDITREEFVLIICQSVTYITLMY